MNIDVQEYIADILDAYTKVYGAEYRDIIEQRMNRIFYIMYNDFDGMRFYLYFLQDCKRKELGIKFLQQIGIDVSKQQEKSYAEDLDEGIYTLLRKYIGGYYCIEPIFKNNPDGIKAWGTLNEDVNPEVEEQKIEFINFLRGQDVTPVTKETFQEFCETDEYKDILKRVKECLQVYEQISKEYEEYLQEILPYTNHVEFEAKRRDEIQISKRNRL